MGLQFAVQDLGTVEYPWAERLQDSLVAQVQRGEIESQLLLLEHPPIITLGASHRRENLLWTAEQYKSQGIELHKSARGGDVTYHGPGQLIAYPVFDLNIVGHDLHRFLRLLEEAVIVCLREWGLEGSRFPPHTGVWIENRKICAIGIQVKRWISMHGLALNCNVDLQSFESIVPCGISEYLVTSMSQRLNSDLSVDLVKPALVEAFATVFG